MIYDVKEIDKIIALSMIKKYHYSNTLPKINKHFIGFYLENNLVGVVTLGYGVQPKGTINKVFSNVKVDEYLEIGRMCMTDEMPRNSESMMLSQLTSFIKQNYKNVKILFTWADGMLGKAGYVYQASGFIYCGYSLTDIYLRNGVKIHPRQTRALLSPNDKRITVRPTLEQMKQYNIEHYKGKQFKYFKFLCSKTEKKKILKGVLFDLNLKNPKDKDLMWLKQNEIGKWEKSEMPNYKTDVSHNDVSTLIKNESKQLSIFDFMDYEK